MTSHTLTLDLTTLTDQYAPRCAPGLSGADAVIQLDVIQPVSLNVLTTPDYAVSNDEGSIVLVRDPCSAMAEVECQTLWDGVPGAPASARADLKVPRVPAGKWFLIIDMEDGTERTETVEIWAGTPASTPTNDTCSSAEPLAFINGHARVQGTTDGALNDTYGFPTTCPMSPSTGQPDVFYTFTLTQPQNLVAVASAGLRIVPELSLSTDCPGRSRLACASAENTYPLQASLYGRNLQAGTYFLTVDGAVVGGGGDFALDVDLFPSGAPANDTCAGAIPLLPNQSVSVDVNSAARDYGASCSPSGTGGDVVYAVTLATPQTIEATAVPNSTTNVAIALRRSPCAGATSEVICTDVDSVNDFGTEVARLHGAAAGTWYVVVSANSNVGGLVGVSVSLTPP